MRWLTHLMDGADINAWQSLADFAFGQGSLVHLYDHIDQRLLPCPDDVPWPVQWLLSSYPKKHIFVAKKAPSVEALHKDFCNFENATKWASLHGSSDKPRFPYAKRIGSTPSCNRVVDPDLQGWLRSLRSRVLTGARSLVRCNAHNGLHNTFGLVSLALRQLKRMPFVVLPKDKEPGFCVVPTHSMKELELRTVSSRFYTAVRPADIKLQSQKVYARKLAKQIENQFELPGISANLMKSVYVGSFFSRLGLLVKSHKTDGQVTCRNLHKSMAFALTGLSRWLSAMLTEHTVLPHNLRDSEHAREVWHNIHVPAGKVRLATLDLKEFFMSGTACELLEAVMSVYSGPCPGIVSDVLFFLLDNQYIILESNARNLIADQFESKLDSLQSTTPMIFKCICGSGMGLPHSGIVANISFYKRVEAKLATSDSLASHSVSKYSRYYDDIVMMYTDRDKFKDFVGKMRHSAKYFTIECSAVSSECVQFLDLDVSLSGGRAVVLPNLDKTVAPLHPSSGQAEHVHRSWPKSVASRVGRLAGPSAREYIQELILKYRRHNACDYTLSIMASNLKGLPPSHTHIKQIPDARKQDESAQPTKWWKVGVHPLWVKCLPRFVGRSRVPESLGFCTRISWKNSSRNFAGILNASNSQKLSVLGGR